MSFWLYFFLFFVAVFLAFFVPGDLILKKLNLPITPRLILGTILGMVLWGMQGFIFGHLGFRWLSYIYLLATSVLWLKICFRYDNKLLKETKHFKPDLLVISLILLGTLLQVTTVWFNGVQTIKGLYFCCGNPSDNLFHIALTNQIIQHFPPFEPGMFGEEVRNYHYWSNLVVAELIRVFRLPLVATQYQYSTVFISAFLGLSALVFGKIINIGRKFTLWLIFFLYFGGDLIYLLLFSLGKGINFNMGSLEDGAQFLSNPPRAFSIIVFLVGISFLVLWIKKQDLRTGLVMAIVLGSLIGFKVYTGIFALSGLAFLGIYFLLTKRLSMIPPLIIALLISAAIYFPVNIGAGGLYFTGLWIFENFAVQPLLGQEHLILAKRIFEDHHNWIRIIITNLTLISMYVISIFGTKLIGVFQSRKSLSIFPLELNIFLLSGIVISTILGFFFQQTSGGANSFNFLVSIFIIGSMYTALTCYYWLEKINKNFMWLLVILIIVLTAPRAIREWSVNLSQLIKQDGFVVDMEQLKAANYLRQNTDVNSLILVDNRGFEMDGGSPYISFLTERQMYLSGKGILDSHGVDTSERYAVAKSVLGGTDNLSIYRSLINSKINYIFMSPNDNLNIEKGKQIKTVFKNSKVKILKIN